MQSYLIQLDDVGVSQYLEDADLAGDSFDVRLLHYFLFLQRFDCDLLIGGGVDGQTDFTESAFSYAFACM